MLVLERATLEKASEYLKILDEGRKFQREQGFTQWTDNYPNSETVIKDITCGVGYAIKFDDKIAGYCCIRFDGEPAYLKIDGKWNYDMPYAVVHRLALSADFRGTGLTGETWRVISEFCRKNGLSLIRVDTGLQNKVMQHVLEKNGFTRCGTVSYYGGDAGLRLAYEKKI